VTAQQRTQIFYGAIALAVIFVIVAILYLLGDSIPSGVHYKHAILAFVLAVGSLVVANFNRPGMARS
jgi:hypothetical protein